MLSKHFYDLLFFAESWNVAFRKAETGEILNNTKTTFKVIKNNFRYWAADPFILEKDGKAYIFAELYDYVLRRGILGYCAIEGDKASKWKPVIKEPYHLSYPCIIEHSGKLCIMPESGEGEVLTVYESVELPDKWEKRKVIRGDVRFADTTPLPFSGRNFALTHNVDDPENPCLTLIDLEGKSKDIPVEGKAALRSRPAGYVFEKDGKLIRPAQYSVNTAEGYGKGLIFCECSLSKDLYYSETEIKKISPEELNYDKPIYLDGMHTYNSSEHYEVIDIKTRRFNILNFIMRIAGKFLP